MMRKPEKSDSVVVAVNPVNRAERSAAELEEPRTETKGSADQQRTRRAQDPESVSQALARVRLAARRGKQERFTSLLHHINPEMLRAAFYALKRDAAPGIDGMTWETYEQGLAARRRVRAAKGPRHSARGAARGGGERRQPHRITP
jgi:RNA-directed DNA polymerase